MKARVFAVMTLAALPLGAVGASAEQGQDQERFRGMDRNRDGVITRAEWRGSAQSFRNHDWNGDGRLAGDEIRPGGQRDRVPDENYSTPRQEFDDWTAEGFRYLDRNRDGGVARNEWFDDRASFVRADTNRDNVLTRAEFLDMATVNGETGFEALDRNNNGRIERWEWRGQAASFESADRNNDGVVTRNEMDVESPRDERFETLDTNNNGRIERREWQGRPDRFDVLDRNNDNVVTQDEMETARDERLETLDTNNNGRIERREWQGRPDRFDTLDRNNDNVVTRDEMLSGPDTSESQTFSTADLNRDNRLSQREWQWSQRVFTDQDTNRDGFVSREEFRSPGAATGATGTSGYADNRTVNSPVVVQVSATERWVDTGLDTRVGDLLRITSSGTVRLSNDRNDQASPDGANRRAEQAPLPFYPAGALIARISNGTPFFIGDGTNVDRVNAAGRLYLSVNDDHLGDNAGNFRVTITIRPQ